MAKHMVTIFTESFRTIGDSGAIDSRSAPIPR